MNLWIANRHTKKLLFTLLAIAIFIFPTISSALADKLYFGDLNFGEPKEVKDKPSACGVYNIKRWENNRYVYVFFISHSDSTVACGLKTGTDDPKAMARQWFNEKVTLDNFGEKTSIKTEYMDYTYQGFRLEMGSFSTNCYSFVSETLRDSRRMYITAVYCGRDKSKEAFLGNLRKIRFADQSPQNSNNKAVNEPTRYQPSKSSGSESNSSQGTDDVETRLRKLKQLEDEGLISKEDATRKRQEILDKL